MFAKIKVALGVAVASAMSLSSLVFQPQIALAANDTFDSKADYAASFNGVNSYGVTGGPVIPASGDYTVEAWVYNDGGDAMREIVAQGDDTANFYMGDIWGDMRVAGAGDLPKSKKAQWYHLAVTKSDSGSYIWVNGQKIAQSFSLGNPAALPLNVGRQFLDYGEFWKGKIDEVRIYSSDRSTSVATDMNSWGNGGEASLLAYYDFNAPVANPDGTYTVADLSGAAVAKPLTLHNFTAADFVDVAEKVDWGTDNRDALVTFPRPYLNSQGGWTSPTGYISYKALVVGGGGGGGAWVGGGGGAGGFKETSETNLTAGTKFSVSVGMGGSGAAYRDGNFNRYGVYNTGNNGYSTNFNDAVISLGGGKGGSFAGSGQYDGVLAGSGANGGGAGGSQDDITGSAPSQYATGGASTVSGGFKGGDQAFPMANLLPGAGGAGAGGAGGNASSDGRTAGNGGPGVLSTITNIKYAGGGGGGVQSNLDVSDPGVTGSAVDGGGAGAGPTQVGQGEVFAAHAVANTGGGGGGAGMSEFYTSVGGDGASGVVILRLKAQAIASQTSVNACDGSTTLNGVKVAAAHPKIFYIDSSRGQELDANYMAYRVTSTTARSDLWVQVSGFTGGSVTLANSADSSQPVGTVAANGTGAVYFLAKASEETNKAQSHVVKVFDRKPGSGGAVPLFTCNSGFSQVAETIKAEANKVDAITTSSVSSIGTTFTITVLGDSGTIGNGNATDGRLLWLSPASRSTWPTGALRLEDTVITTYSDAARATVLKTFSNSLALNTSSGLSANNRQYYKAVYTFRIIGNATSVASISPSAMISSGTQVKHVSFDKLPTGTSSKVNVVNPTQTVTVAGSASSTAQVRNNGTTRVTYTLTIKNTGSKDVELDELYDRGDDGDDEDDEEEDHEEYVKGSTKKNGEEHEDGEEDDDDKQKHVFSGPFKIPAKSSITIEYQVDVKTCQKGEKYKKEHKSGGSIGGSDDDEDEDHDGHDDDGDGDHDGEDDDEDHGHKIGSSKTTHSNVEVTGKCGEPAQAVKVTNQVQDPVVKTGTAVPVAATSATLYGTVDPNGVSGLPVKFSYSTSPSLVGATSVNLANTTSAGDPYVVKSAITGLTPGTRYYYRLTIVQPGNVEKSGAIYHLDTEFLPGVPTAETAPVTLISNSDKGALFTGAITAARVAGGAKVRFEWAADTSNGACTSVGSVSNSGNLKNGSSDAVLTNAGATDMTHRVTGFTASAKYCVRIVALHGTGYTTRVVGGWVAFTQAPKTSQSISWNNVMPPLPAGGSTTVAATATSSLAVTYTSVDPTVCSVNPSTGAVSAVADFGLCSITATQDGDDTYYPALPKTISFEIVPPKVVTSSLPAGEYQSAFTSTTLEAEGGNGTYSNWSVVGTLPAGLTISSQGVLSGTPTAAGLYTITVTVESNGVTSAPRDLSIVIETASIAVIANDATVTFGDAVPAIGYTVSSFLGGDKSLNTAPKCETNYQVGDAAGATGKATFCADAWDPNYTVTYVSGELTVEKFAVVVAASAKAKQNLSNGTNRPDPAFEYTLTPALPGGQTVADVLPAGVNFARSSGEAPGNYSITPSAASTGSNYDVTFVDGTLTVQQPQIVPALNATDFEVAFGDALGLGLVADAKDDQTDVSGTWVFSYVDENNQIQVVTSATELPAGLYTITAEFTPTDGATFYGPVSTVMNLTVNKKVVTITSEEAEKLVNSLDPDLEYSAAGFLGGDTVDDLGQVLVTREPGEAPGTYDVTTSGGSNPNYTVQHVKATLFITKLTIVPVVNADGSNARQVSITCQGAKPGSTVTLTIGAVILGTYTVAANGTCAATKLTIPSSIPDGPHTITAAGEFPSGASLSDSTPALFVAPPVNNGGNTGGNTGGNSGGGVVVKPGKLKATKTFSGFRPGSHHLTTAMKSQLKAWVAANPKLNRLTCTGFTMGKTVLPIDEKLSWNRAFFACQYVKQIKPSLKIVWVKGKQETVFGDPIRRVELTLTNY